MYSVDSTGGYSFTGNALYWPISVVLIMEIPSESYHRWRGGRVCMYFSSDTHHRWGGGVSQYV